MSDYGAGLVVCLAKFSEHLNEHRPYSERQIREYASYDAALRERDRQEAAQYPHGDAAQRLARVALMDISRDVRGSVEQAVSAGIEHWAYAASDHFYDLDRERAPAPLTELADLVLAMRWPPAMGESGRPWTVADLDRMRELWKESCLALDRKLGTEPDWGEW